MHMGLGWFGQNVYHRIPKRKGRSDKCIAKDDQTHLKTTIPNASKFDSQPNFQASVTEIMAKQLPTSFYPKIGN